MSRMGWTRVPGGDVRVARPYATAGKIAGWRPNRNEETMDRHGLLVFLVLLMAMAMWSTGWAQDPSPVKALTCNENGLQINQPDGGCRRLRNTLEGRTQRKLKATCELVENHCRRKAVGGFYRYRKNFCRNSIEGCGCCVYAPR